ncbi:hypothetical protein BDQ12DRAFT_675914 [Crucibulum laeve]|uniref:Secreted protein n=1 Tax=Crucibulum laeve TaxID=68775 RepID=A0A5C3MF60_9AGAR|nr:hypothetical protein BDQ12DRAFT_675914 [Crucibulum laeve]
MLLSFLLRASPSILLARPCISLIPGVGSAQKHPVIFFNLTYQRAKTFCINRLTSTHAPVLPASHPPSSHEL